MDRKDFAARLASGLSGWLQQLSAQDLEHQVGEDAARVELIRIIHAQRKYTPDTSRRPTNWPDTTKRRIDIAVLGKHVDAEGWHGAIELKWPGTAVDVKQVRQTIVEDAVRISFTETANLKANFIVVGGTLAALDKLFSMQHRAGGALESQRRSFCSLFSRNMKKPNGHLPNKDLNQSFPDFDKRLPHQVIGTWKRRLATELIAKANASIGADVRGRVYVWQCFK